MKTLNYLLGFVMMMFAATAVQAVVSVGKSAPEFTLTDAIAHCLDVHRVCGEERCHEPGNL